MTVPGSAADVFCAFHLVPLDWSDNPFLRSIPTTVGVPSLTLETIHVVNRQLLITEIFYTENMNLDGLTIRHDVPTSGSASTGETTPGEMLKNQDCNICNLNEFERFDLLLKNLN